MGCDKCQAAEAKVAALTRERDEQHRHALNWQAKANGQIETVAALQERVKELEEYKTREIERCRSLAVAWDAHLSHAAISRLPAPEKERRDCVDPVDGKCLEHSAPEKHEHDFCTPLWKPIPGTAPGFEQQQYCYDYKCECGALRFGPPSPGKESK